MDLGQFGQSVGQAANQAGAAVDQTEQAGQQAAQGVIDGAEQVAGEVVNAAGNAPTNPDGAAATAENGLGFVIMAAAAALSGSQADQMQELGQALSQLKVAKDRAGNLITSAGAEAGQLISQATSAMAVSTLTAIAVAGAMAGRVSVGTLTAVAGVVKAVIIYVATQDAQAGQAQLGKLKSELGRLDSSLEQLIREIARAQKSETEAARRVKTTLASDPQIAASLRKTAALLAGLRRAGTSAARPPKEKNWPPSDKHFLTTAGQLKRLYRAVDRTTIALQGNSVRSPRMVQAFGAMRLMQVHFQSATTQLAQAREVARAIRKKAVA